jgi:hypothetical protein
LSFLTRIEDFRAKSKSFNSLIGAYDTHGSGAAREPRILH